jgi:hypothetical protein
MTPNAVYWRNFSAHRFDSFCADTMDWVGELMDAQARELGSEALLHWYAARYRHPTKEQWLAMNPSSGQSYEPFPLPRPRAMRDGVYTFPAKGTPDVWLYNMFIVDASMAVVGPENHNFAAIVFGWVGNLMEDQMRDLARASAIMALASAVQGYKTLAYGEALKHIHPPT